MMRAGPIHSRHLAADCTVPWHDAAEHIVGSFQGRIRFLVHPDDYGAIRRRWFGWDDLAARQRARAKGVGTKGVGGKRMLHGS